MDLFKFCNIDVGGANSSCQQFAFFLGNILISKKQEAVFKLRMVHKEVTEQLLDMKIVTVTFSLMIKLSPGTPFSAVQALASWKQIHLPRCQVLALRKVMMLPSVIFQEKAVTWQEMKLGMLRK